MILLRLFFEFFKIGLFSIGGGAATIPFLFELSETTGWYTAVQLTDFIAVSEATPGAIGVNMASYVGYTVSGISGCVIATLGLVTPSIISIVLIYKILSRFGESPFVASAFSGLRPASLALISVAFTGIFRVSLLRESLYASTGVLSDLLSPWTTALAIVIFIAMQKLKGHPLIYIFISAVAGIALKLGV